MGRFGFKKKRRTAGVDVDLSTLSPEELRKMAIRDNIAAENDAIALYTKYIELLPEGDPVRTGLEDIRREEKEHAGELQQLLEDLDPEEADDMDEGRSEVLRESRGTVRRAFSITLGEPITKEDIFGSGSFGMVCLVRGFHFIDGDKVYAYVPSKKGEAIDRKTYCITAKAGEANLLTAKVINDNGTFKLGDFHTPPGGPTRFDTVDDGIVFLHDKTFEDEDGNVHVASRNANFSTAPRVPTPVSESETQSTCPLCHSNAFDGEYCDTCGFHTSPDGMGAIEIDEKEKDDDKKEGKMARKSRIAGKGTKRAIKKTAGFYDVEPNYGGGFNGIGDMNDYLIWGEVHPVEYDRDLELYEVEVHYELVSPMEDNHTIWEETKTVYVGYGQIDEYVAEQVLDDNAPIIPRDIIDQYYEEEIVSEMMFARSVDDIAEYLMDNMGWDDANFINEYARDLARKYFVFGSSKRAHKAGAMKGGRANRIRKADGDVKFEDLPEKVRRAWIDDNPETVWNIIEPSISEDWRMLGDICDEAGIRYNIDSYNRVSVKRGAFYREDGWVPDMPDPVPGNANDFIGMTMEEPFVSGTTKLLGIYNECVSLRNEPKYAEISFMLEDDEYFFSWATNYYLTSYELVQNFIDEDEEPERFNRAEELLEELSDEMYALKEEFDEADIDMCERAIYAAVCAIEKEEEYRASVENVTDVLMYDDFTGEDWAQVLEDYSHLVTSARRPGKAVASRPGKAKRASANRHRISHRRPCRL